MMSKTYTVIFVTNMMHKQLFLSTEVGLNNHQQVTMISKVLPSGGHKMVYWGHYNGYNKFRCSHVLGKVECCHGSIWCSNSNYGYVVKTKIKDDPRYITIPHRGSKGCQKVYNKRTSVERVFSKLKKHLNLENLTVMGAQKVKTHVLLSCISLIVSKLAIEKLKYKGKTPVVA